MDRARAFEALSCPTPSWILRLHPTIPREVLDEVYDALVTSSTRTRFERNCGGRFAVLFQIAARNHPEKLWSVVREYANTHDPAVFSYVMETEFRNAAHQNQLDMVRALLQIAKRVPCGLPKEEILVKAVLCGDRNTVKELVDAGTSVDDRDSAGYTTIMNACLRGDDVEIVQILVHAGADTAARDNHGRTALMIAAQEGRHRAVEFLLTARNNVRDTDARGWTALHYAAISTSPLPTKLILEAGAPVHARGVTGDTALQVCARFGQCAEAAKLLLEHGADPYSTGLIRGQSVRDAAAHSRGKDAERTLEVIEQYMHVTKRRRRYS